MSKPINSLDLDVTKINIEKLKVKKNEKTKKETKQCKINYGNSEFRMKVPKSKLPFGPSVNKEEGSDYTKYSFQVNVEDPDFRGALEKIDTKIVNYVSENSMDWWKTHSTPDEVRKFTYSSLIKKDKKGEYPDSFKFKLPFYNGEPKFTVFNDKKEKLVIYKKNESGQMEMDWSWAQKHMYLEAVIQCVGLWIVNKNVYCTYELVQAKIYPLESNDVNFFDDDDEVKSLTTKVSEVKVQDPVIENDSVDEDTDGEASDEE